MIVVKLGGGADIDWEPLLRELATHPEPWVLIHGGNEELTAHQDALGQPAQFITSPSGHISRRTDAKAMASIQRVYRGRINNELVLRLQRLGCNAVGLSGIDGRMWQATRKPALRAIEDGKKMLIRDDLTGTIHSVDATLLRLLLDDGFAPVVTLPALADGEAVNVDGDRAAAATAAALHADTLVILSNVPGLLRDPTDPQSLVERIARHELAENERFAQGRFRKKMMAVQEALDGGVRRVVLGDARRAQPLQDALAGRGTVVT